MIKRRESDCVDCVGVSEFDHGLYIFLLVWMLRK